MAIRKHTTEAIDDLRPVVIYGETANINHFLDIGLVPDATEGPTLEAVQMPGRSRRQYPGDASQITVSGGTAVFLRDPSRSSGSALPGRPFVLKEIIEDAGLGEPGEVRQFTFTGAISDLVAFFRQNTTKRIDLVSPRGAKYKINAEVGGA